MNLLNLSKEVQDEIIRRRIKTSVAEELAYIKDKEQQSKLAQLVAKRHITLTKFREIATSADNPTIEGTITPQSQREKNAVRAFDKTIVALKLAFNRLNDIIANVEDDWIVRESLLHQRMVIHSQIDIILKVKKKYSKLSDARRCIAR